MEFVPVAIIPVFKNELSMSENKTDGSSYSTRPLLKFCAVSSKKTKVKEKKLLKQDKDV